MGQPAAFLTVLKCPQKLMAFSLARCNVMPGAVSNGRYNGTPYLKRHCPCEQGALETLTHMLWHCPLHQNCRKKYVTSILLKLDGKFDLDKARFMLSVEVVNIMEQVASFLGSIVRGRSPDLE